MAFEDSDSSQAAAASNARASLQPAAGTLERFLSEVEQQAYRMAHAALWDRDTALDVVQDSMLKLVEKYSARPADEWPLLFFRILGNRITDARRWRMLHEGKRMVISWLQRDPDNALESLANAGRDSSHSDTDPEQDATGAQLRQRIEAAVRRLPDQQRQVFMLREWQGFSSQETAQVLQCSVGTVKQHHFRALQTLRKALAEVWNDGY